MPYYTNTENCCLHKGSVQGFPSLESNLKLIFLLPNGCKLKHLCNPKDLKILLVGVLHRKKGFCPVVKSKEKNLLCGGSASKRPV